MEHWIKSKLPERNQPNLFPGCSCTVDVGFCERAAEAFIIGVSKNYKNALIHGFVCQRLGSGDGERKTLLTRQMPHEPLPASVLFGVGVVRERLME